ncbi:MAG: putative transporter [Prevotellaceae bacterium]|nr:putative transporter [Prevotella sp.]MDD7605119.1 putative transporter [Prevotellaceae bacterium]
MDWITEILSTDSPVHSIVALSLICALGLALGKVRVMGISLGVAFVFFIGILAGHFGLRVNAQCLGYAETFGLVIFVYMLGLSVGPNFFGSLRREGMPLNLWSLAIILLGTLLAVVLVPLTGVSLPDMVGLLCGATTNTPALGAAQQALQQAGHAAGTLALGTAVTYPFGVVGVIIVMVILRRVLVRPADLQIPARDDANKTYIGEFLVVNPALDGKKVSDFALNSHERFIISRIWRGQEVIVPGADTELRQNDKVLVITNKDDRKAMEILFGRETATNWNADQIDWNHIDAEVASRTVVVTRKVLNGKHLVDLQLRSTYGVNVSRVLRGDLKLLATDDLRLQYGDRVVVVGPPSALDNVEKFIGNAVQTLNEPNLGSIFLGMVLGLLLGLIPVAIPGAAVPVHLGVAGGPIIMGIIVGALGPKAHIISYTTRSASLILRKFGLSLYLACLGLEAGKDFFHTLIRPEGLMWIGIGALLTLIPIFIIGVVMLRMHKYDFGTICGVLCGSMANPMALGYANDTIQGETPSLSYASVYPLGMFIRVLIAQVLIMFFI